MATQPVLDARASQRVRLELVALFQDLRVLAWERNTLYASRGYRLLCACPDDSQLTWTPVGYFQPAWWRSITCHSALSSRLFRDGFHALSIHPCGNLIGVVPGGIVTRRANEPEFRITHRITRGTRPLHITTTPDGMTFWGEYFDNPARGEVHIYASADGGLTWQIAYTFEKGSIRHIHNILYDRWQRCLWILTGDYGRECRILRASPDFSEINDVLAGTQQARAVAAVITEDGMFFASDTPLERNFIYFLDREGRRHTIHFMPSSSIYGCQNSKGIFFSSMVEPSEINRIKNVTILGGTERGDWEVLASWRKDLWPMKYFQYGNAFLPDGVNTTDLLAATTIGVEGADLQTTIWRTVQS